MCNINRSMIEAKHLTTLRSFIYLIEIYSFRFAFQLTNFFLASDSICYIFFMVSIHSSSPDLIIGPIRPFAVVNRLIGEFPSVMRVDLIPSPARSFAWVAGPAFAMSLIVSLPIASTIFLNFSVSIARKILKIIVASRNWSKIC